VSATLRSVVAAVGGFLRGFLGLDPRAARTPARDPAAARHALERRAAGRRGCC
jgi:hypothetical protein